MWFFHDLSFQLFDVNCVNTSNLKQRRRSRKGIDPDEAVRLLSIRGYEVSKDQAFRITQGTEDHIADEQSFSNFISKQGFEYIVTGLRRKREKKQEASKKGRIRSTCIAAQPWFKKQESIQALQSILDVPEQKATEMVNQCMSVSPSDANLLGSHKII